MKINENLYIHSFAPMEKHEFAKNNYGYADLMAMAAATNNNKITQSVSFNQMHRSRPKFCL